MRTGRRGKFVGPLRFYSVRLYQRLDDGDYKYRAVGALTLLEDNSCTFHDELVSHQHKIEDPSISLDQGGSREMMDGEAGWYLTQSLAHQGLNASCARSVL